MAPATGRVYDYKEPLPDTIVQLLCPIIHTWVADPFWTSVCRDTLRTQMKRFIPVWKLRQLSIGKAGAQTACALAVCHFNDRVKLPSLPSVVNITFIKVLTANETPQKSEVCAMYPREHRSHEDWLGGRGIKDLMTTTSREKGLSMLCGHSVDLDLNIDLYMPIFSIFASFPPCV